MASWSGLWDNEVPKRGTFTPGYVPIDSKALRISGGSPATIDSAIADAHKVSKLFRGNRLNAKLRAYFAAAIGAAAGASVNGGSALNDKRVDHPATPLSVGALGGSRAIASVQLIAASTTTAAADNTNLKAYFSKTFAIVPASMPTDKSGNGGGARLTAKYLLS